MKKLWASASAAVLAVASWGNAQAPSAAEPSSPPVVVTETQTIATPSQVATSVPATTPCSSSGCRETESGFWDCNESGSVPYRFWARGEFLVWKTPSATLPSLTTTVPVGVIVVQTQDRFESPSGNLIRFGNIVDNFAPVRVASTATPADGTRLSHGEQFGARFTAGFWLDSEETLGLEGSGFYLTRRSLGFHSTNGNSVNQFLVDFPFTSSVFVVTPATATTAETSTLRRTFPTFVVRQSTSDLGGRTSNALWGAELNARSTSASLGAASTLFGLRYINFREDLQTDNSVRLFLPPGFQDQTGVGTDLMTNLPTDLRYRTLDSVNTRNDFYGAQVGLDLDMDLGRFTLALGTKAALGVMHQTVNILGRTTLPDGSVTAGGLLSSANDAGSHSRNRIAFASDGHVKVGYRITPNWRAYVGYDFMYLSTVLRPGDQTGLSSSTIQVTVAGTTNQFGVSQPAYRSQATDLWINGISVGMDIRF